MIGLSILLVFFSLIMCACSKYSCRYLLYFICFFITFIAILSLLVTVFISFIIPPFQWGCDYLKYSMQSQSNFACNSPHI